MGKTFTLVLFMFVATFVKSQTTYTVTNSGFTFSPDSISINVGDAIQWNQASTHPVTEVTPSAWSANQNTPQPGGFTASSGQTTTFTTAGVYYYVCNNHYPMGMKGRIFVNSVTSIKKAEKASIPSVNLFPSTTNTSFNISVSGELNRKVDVIIYDILGNIVKKIYAQEINSGIPIEIDVINLQQGNYFVKISGNNFSETKRFTKN